MSTNANAAVAKPSEARSADAQDNDDCRGTKSTLETSKRASAHAANEPTDHADLGDEPRILDEDRASKCKVRFSLRDSTDAAVAVPQSPDDDAKKDSSTSDNKPRRRSHQHHDHERREQLKKEEELKNHRASLSFYTQPVQRQRWGDVQLKPHTNWGDIFFDLFYVASAYNLGNLLRFEPTARGLLYFTGCFAPVQVLWFTKMRYDARFFTREDVWHQTYEIAVLLVLSTVVLHIRPVNIMSNPSAYVDMFVFALGLLLAQILVMGRHVEILCGVDGDEGAKHSARNEIRHEVIPMAFYGAAMVIAGVKYYGSDHEASKVVVSTTDLPIWLCLAGTLASMVWITLVVLVFLPKGGNHKKVSVPMNIDYSIHRYGEWIMLMLGEGVLSLLIVDITNVPGYYVTFFGGIVSLTLMEYLHFRSQPLHPDQHAMRRSKEAGMTFSIVMQVYSGALIVLGASYKMFLYDFIYETTASGGHRRALFPLLSRVLRARELAGGDDLLRSDSSSRRQHVANLFCGSLALSWLCLDILILTHRGLTVNFHRCQCKGSKKIRPWGAALIVMRLLLILFIATVSRYDTTPETVSLWGMAGILAQVVLRVVGGYIFPDDPMNEGDGDEMRWPNVTEPQSEPFESDADVAVDDHA